MPEDVDDTIGHRTKSKAMYDGASKIVFVQNGRVVEEVRFHTSAISFQMSTVDRGIAADDLVKVRVKNNEISGRASYYLSLAD